ncbi:PIN domain-containing protein [Streptomyces fimicarius]|uniref:PIN domain-containing protein n=1 Tax=Streptomyces griseus TaxID=1911 RepID=UPI0036B9F57E
MLIILDTSTIRGAGLRSPTADLLRAITASEVETVAVPWVAMEELAAQKAIDYLKAWDRAVRALEALDKESPWPPVAQVGAADPEKVRQEWRQRWGQIVEVLPVSLAVMQQAVTREANALPPCESWPDGQKKQEKIGGRDAAIWLTATDYAREHPEETVYFVSGNHKDFTDGQSGYPYPMDQDIDGFGNRFVHLTDLADLLPRFATQTDVEIQQVQAVCDASDVRRKIVSDAHLRWEMSFSPEVASGFACTWHDPQGGQVGLAGGWLDPKGVEACLMDLEVVSAHKIGDQTWVSAEAKWALSGYTLLAPPDDQFVMADMQYDTRLLMSLKGDGDVTVLHGARPHALDNDAVSTPTDDGFINHERMKAALDALRDVLSPPTLRDVSTRSARMPWKYFTPTWNAAQKEE